MLSQVRVDLAPDATCAQAEPQARHLRQVPQSLLGPAEADAYEGRKELGNGEEDRDEA